MLFGGWQAACRLDCYKIVVVGLKTGERRLLPSVRMAQLRHSQMHLLAGRLRAIPDVSTFASKAKNRMQPQTQVTLTFDTHGTQWLLSLAY
jgi:hypothetical protein